MFCSYSPTFHIRPGVHLGMDLCAWRELPACVLHGHRLYRRPAVCAGDAAPAPVEGSVTGPHVTFHGLSTLFHWPSRPPTPKHHAVPLSLCTDSLHRGETVRSFLP